MRDRCRIAVSRPRASESDRCCAVFLHSWPCRWRSPHRRVCARRRTRHPISTPNYKKLIVSPGSQIGHPPCRSIVAAEARARTSGTPSQLLYAKFGRLRGEMQVHALGDLSAELGRDLARPIVARDRRLRLRGLTVKGDIDLEWDVQAALRDWQQVRQLAVELGEKGWENRAAGELGMIAFLKGNTGEAGEVGSTSARDRQDPRRRRR